MKSICAVESSIDMLNTNSPLKLPQTQQIHKRFCQSINNFLEILTKKSVKTTNINNSKVPIPTSTYCLNSKIQ